MAIEDINTPKIRVSVPKIVPLELFFLFQDTI
jgi:hypothetical protein